MITSLNNIEKKFKLNKPLKVVVCGHVNETIINMLKELEVRGIINGGYLFGNKINKLANFNLKDYKIIEDNNSKIIVEKSIKYMLEEKADILIKGLISTAKFMEVVLKLKKDAKLISHVMAYDLENRDKLLFITDPSINISPSLDKKVEIIKNSIDLTNNLGFDNPKIAILSYSEKVDFDSKSSYEGAVLSKKFERDKYKNAIVEGPLSLDLALNKESAEIKGFVSKIIGNADILFMPELVSGNCLAKSLSLLGNSNGAGIVMGTKKPVILTSRSATITERISSIMLTLAYFNI